MTECNKDISSFLVTAKPCDYQFFLEAEKNNLLGLQEAGLDIHREIIRNEGGAIEAMGRYQSLAWDSSFFGYPVGRLEGMFLADNEDNSRTRLKLVDALLEKNVSGLTACRFRADDIELAQALEKRGFRLVDAMQIYTVDLRCTEVSLAAGILTDLSIDGIDDVVRGCIKGMQYGRFFADLNILREKAESYYLEVSRYYLKQEGACCVVLSDQGKDIGFAIGVVDGNKTEQLGKRYAYLWLIAVDPAYQGMGFGKQLFDGFLWRMKDVADVVEIGTQIWNVPANRLYVDRGCKPVSSLLSYHLWSDQ